MESEKDYWNNRYQKGYGSGDGSYGEVLERKLSLLRQLKDVRSITEIGCGDFNFGKHVLKLFPDASYFGVDTSDVVIDRNRKLYESEKVEFYNAVPGCYVKNGDLLLCVDVLFHVYDDNIVSILLEDLKKSWTKYLALTAYEYDGIRKYHIRVRKFPPEFFGTPIIREAVEDDGELFFYVFKR